MANLVPKRATESILYSVGTALLRQCAGHYQLTTTCSRRDFILQERNLQMGHSFAPYDLRPAHTKPSILVIRTDTSGLGTNRVRIKELEETSRVN